MRQLIKRFSGLVKGTLSGFDRIVFKGFVLPLMSAKEVMHFCRVQGVLNKDYKEWMMAQTRSIIEIADQYAKDNRGHTITHIPTWRTRKETLAQNQQKKEQIASGLIGVWSCLDSDYQQAQRLMDEQLDAGFAELLKRFLPTVFPTM